MSDDDQDEFDFENAPRPKVSTPGPLRLLGVKDGLVHISFRHEGDKASFTDGVLQPDEAIHLGELLVRLGQKAMPPTGPVARVLPIRAPKAR